MRPCRSPEDLCENQQLLLPTCIVFKRTFLIKERLSEVQPPYPSFSLTVSHILPQAWAVGVIGCSLQTTLDGTWHFEVRDTRSGV